ncbi:MAG: GNAT family N-acetyltransferase, partial [Thermoplasmata archaeon]|nr:GNAT family N-acetyltransferase [Thermoplasmata archaeon]
AASFAAPDGTWNPAMLEWATKALADGRFIGRLWVGPGGDEAVGLAIGLPPGEVGGRVEVVSLDEGFRHPAALATFLRRLDAPDAFGPLVELPDRPRTVDAASYEPVTRSLGLVPVERIDMRYPPERPRLVIAPDPTTRLRNARAEDLEGIAALTVRAYGDNPVDTALFRRSRDPMTDARVGTAAIFGTAVGAWLSSASFVIEHAGSLVGATLVNEHGGALITQVMVDPSARGRGHASRLIAASIAALRHEGRDDIRLVVTRTNRRAERLYLHLGFVPDPSTSGANWIHAGRLGLTPKDLEGN